MSDEERKLDPESQEAWDYLVEVVKDYQRYMSDLGSLGLAAPNLLYYRDEIQEGLEEFKADKRVDFRQIWEVIRSLDDTLRAKAKEVVDEIGHNNFKQYRIINDPPKAYWWWYLDRLVPPPPPPPPAWQFWRHLQTKAPEPEPPASEEQAPSEASS